MSRRSYLKLGGIAAFAAGGSKFAGREATAASQSPYGGSAWALPGRVAAEDFDTGGEGVAYHDTSNGNSGGAYRDTDVDIQQADDTSGEYNVGWTEDGEWLEYTVDVTDASTTYDVLVRVAGKNASASIDVTLGGESLGTVDVPETGGWQDWTTAKLTDVSVSSGGEQVLRLDFNGGDFNVNWVEFVDTGTSNQSPYGGSAWALPGRVAAEDFDTGGEGVAYHDTSDGNSGGAYRDTDVDIQRADDTSGEYNVGWTEDGEWLEYTVDVTDASTTYDVLVRVAGKNASASIDVTLGGESLGTVDVPETGDWQDWTTAKLTDVSVSSGGEQVLRLDFNGGDFNVNWVEFAENSATTSGSAPTVDSLGLSEVETDDRDAEFDADWAVADGDADLDSIDLTLANTDTGTDVDSASVSVSGSTASGTTRLVAGGADGSGDTYEVACTVTDSAGNSASGTATATESEPSGQSPYGGSAWALPGRVAAEDFDTGGEGVAYHDTSNGNSGGAYRDTDVDIQQADDTSGEYNVGWTEDGEWLEYTVDVTDASTTYDVLVRVAGKNASASIDVTLGGESLGTVDVPETGDWQDWTTAKLTDVSVSSGGEQVLRLDFNGGDFNVNWVEFVDGESKSATLDVVGAQQTWHKTTLVLDGPTASETDSRNPFLDYRFAVEFTGPSGQTVTVPGYFAADGDAANTGATAGTVWEANLLADEAGTWEYRTVFEEGTAVAVDPGTGSTTEYHDISGSFEVTATDKAPPDMRAKGLLVNPGSHYLQFQGSGEYYLESGANSPENFLSYEEFDQSGSTHAYSPHTDDWENGDPTWDGGRGKGIVGAVNYLVSQGINAHYFITYTIDGGDGDDVWPWISTNDRLRFDVSKLAQWEVVLGHMTRNGIAPHLVLTEKENDDTLDDGTLGTVRKLYYREMVARFGWHPALIWCVGEEHDPTLPYEEFAAFLRGLDPYGHPVGVHNYPSETGDLWDPVMGDRNFDFGPLQHNDNAYDGSTTIQQYRQQSADAGQPWSVVMSEVGDGDTGIPCDGQEVNGVTPADCRRDALWPNLVGGGAAGHEYYFGYQTCANDVDTEDYRTRDQWWDWAGHAHSFFVDNLPFWEMSPDNASTSAGYMLGHPDGTHYAVYLPGGSEATVDIASGSFTLKWYDPTTGQFEAEETVEGGSDTALGSPISGDAAALLVQQ